jgi:hypothetical protein
MKSPPTTRSTPGMSPGQVQVTAPDLQVRYLGPLITNTAIPGERKSDGVIPAHPGSGALRVAEDRWIIFFATLDLTGSDCNRSILYQLRADAPDGTLLCEGAIDRSSEDWDPLGRGDRFVKSCGMPIAFGVPKGATRAGKPMPNANVFVVKWYRWAHLRQGNEVLNPSHSHDRWPEGLAVKQQTLRVEWMQFRLNDSRDDIDPITEPMVLRQKGYGEGEAYCSLGPDIHMNHAMKAPVAEDESCRTWVSCDTFTPYKNGYMDHGEVAPVRFTFDHESGLYQWTDTGEPTRLPGRVIGEASVNRISDQYVISLRCFEYNGRSSETVWIKAHDLFDTWSKPTYSNAPSVPRMSFACGDGVLRLFCNAPDPDYKISGGDSRAVLGCWDVDPESLRLHGSRVLLDSRKMAWGFNDPVVDMAKLCPPQGRRQLLLFRVIDRSFIAKTNATPNIKAEAFAMSGIHALELTLPRPAAPEWTFEPNN